MVTSEMAMITPPHAGATPCPCSHLSHRGGPDLSLPFAFPPKLIQGAVAVKRGDEDGDGKMYVSDYGILVIGSQYHA